MHFLQKAWDKLARKEADYQPFVDRSVRAKEPFSLERFREELSDITDLVIQKVSCGSEQEVIVIYLKTMTNIDVIQNTIIEPFLLSETMPTEICSLFHQLEANELNEAIQQVLVGNSLVLLNEQVYTVNTFSAPTRAIAPSDQETSVYGPQESFVESAEVNVSMIRRRVHSRELKMSMCLVGTETQTSVHILYMDNIVNKDYLVKIKQKISRLKYHQFIASPALRNALEDNPASPFPQINLTSRVDDTLLRLLDGRIVLIVDGSPNVLICPTSFFESFTSADDYYVGWMYASFTRFLRFAGFFLSIMLSAIYVAITTYHPGILPEALLYVLTISRVDVAIRPYMEVLLLEFLIDAIRESGLRMPLKIGQTIGIIGGIVIGTAAVQAGLVSNVLVVLVAMATLLSYTAPVYMMSNAMRLVRYIFIIGAAWYGFFGIALVFAVLLIHLLGLTSVGSVYTAPLIPRKWTDLSDSLILAPFRWITNRSGISHAKQKLTHPLEEQDR